MTFKQLSTSTKLIIVSYCGENVIEYYLLYYPVWSNNKNEIENIYNENLNKVLEKNIIVKWWHPSDHEFTARTNFKPQIFNYLKMGLLNNMNIKKDEIIINKVLYLFLLNVLQKYHPYENTLNIGHHNPSIINYTEICR